MRITESVDFLSLAGEFNSDTFAFLLDIDEAETLTVITQEEVEAASAIWHRQHVTFADASSGQWLHGQANSLAYPLIPQLLVTIPSGTKVVFLGNDDLPVITVFPVVAILLRQDECMPMSPESAVVVGSA